MPKKFTNYVIETNCPDYNAIPFDYYGNARFAALPLLAAGFQTKLYRVEYYTDGKIIKVLMPISKKAIIHCKHHISEIKDELDILNIPNFYEKYFSTASSRSSLSHSAHG